MVKHSITTLFILSTLALTSWSAVTAQDDDSRSQPRLRLGTASVDITPPLHTPMAGYYSPRGAEGVHDPLLAVAMVLSDGTSKIAIISLDLIKTDVATVKEARRLIAKQTGIAGEAVMISATHSHTGPMIASQSDRDDDFGGNDPLVTRYMLDLPTQIAKAVARADAELRPIQASFAVGRCEGIAFNRRFFMRDGSVGWNPGKLNSNIIRPAGPVDEDIPIVAFHDDDGSPRAAYVNYSLHLDTVGGTEFSADMPYTLRSLLGGAKGKDFLTLYTTACCGDVNHINVQNAQPQKGHPEAARIGTRLAADVLKTLDRTIPVGDVTVRYAQRFVHLPCYEINDQDADQSREVLARVRDPKAEKPIFREMVPAYRAADVLARDHQPFRVEVQVLSIGDQIAWVSLPGEVFVELGMSIRQGSPYPCTAIAELANGSIGYIPNRVAYPQGNYEVNSARCAAGSGEMLVDTAIEMLRELYAKTADKK
jgi:neutral ceramidase